MEAKDYLRQKLDEQDLTQQELGDALGIAQSTVAQWLSGRRPIPATHALRMQQLYGWDAVSLCPKLRGLLPTKEPKRRRSK
jgi:transcriptional regulator with XRE-family HTH domain